MKYSLIVCLLLVGGCAKTDQQALFDQPYASYCDFFDDFSAFVLDKHVLYSKTDQDHLQSIALKQYQVQTTNEIPSSNAPFCQRLEHTFDQRKDKTLAKANFYRGFMDLYLKRLDPHSLYIAPSHVEKNQKRIQNKIKTSGVEYYYRHPVVGKFSTRNQLWIDYVHPGAGVNLPVGQKVTAVKGKPLMGLALAEIAKLLSVGPSYTLVFADQNESVEIQIQKDVFADAYIKYIASDHETVAWVRIKSFSKSMAKTLIHQLEAEKNEYDALVIDLRGNGGGLLDEVDVLLDYFLDPMATYQKGNLKKKTFSTSKSTHKARNTKPMHVFVDSTSASSSEIFAGVLQKAQRAHIVGSPTFGKMTSQQSFLISEKNGIGGMVFVTDKVIYFQDQTTAQYNQLHPDIHFEDPETHLLGQFQEILLERQYANAIKPYQKATNSNPDMLEPCPVDVLRDCTHMKVLGLF